MMIIVKYFLYSERTQTDGYVLIARVTESIVHSKLYYHKPLDLRLGISLSFLPCFYQFEDV
jgi:hypothetical protein